MEGRLQGKRDDFRCRRRASRRSVLVVKRGLPTVVEFDKPEGAKKKVPTMMSIRQTRARTAQEELSQRLRERKERRVITAREVKKARPPFNNYISVKHTGLSPYRSFQQVTSRSKVPLWRTAGAPPANQGRVALVNRLNSAQQQRIPVANLAPGVVQFPMAPHEKKAMKTNLKVLPIALAANRVVGNRPAPLTRSKAPVKELALGLTSKVPILKPANVREMKPVNVRDVKPVNIREVKPPKPPLAPKRTALTENAAKKVVRNIPEQPKIPPRVDPSNRILRSSKRFGTANVENVGPTRKGAQGGTTVLVKKAAPKIKPPVVTSASQQLLTERSEGLKERSDKLTVETERLKQLADTWAALKSHLPLPTNIVEDIDSIVGQTNLLVKEKFQQYKGLIDTAKQEDKITLNDLDGFWETMYLQVKQLDAKYRQLEEMKEKNWSSRSSRLFKNVQVRQIPVEKASQRATKSSFRASREPKKDETNEVETANRSVWEPRNPSFCCVVATISPNSNGNRAPNLVNLTPRAFENTQRASRSTRFSTTMLRLSSIFD